MGKLCCSVVFAGLGILLVIGGCLTIFSFDTLVLSQIQKELGIAEGTPAAERWINPPVKPVLRVYFFNMTNADDFMNKTSKPILDEIGPYVYEEHWKKVNVKFNDNGTVSYSVLKYYYFDREQSVGSESDVIHTLNIPVVVAVDRVKHMNNFIKLTVSSMLQVLNETAFTKKNVSDLMWGYKDPLLDLGNRIFPPEQQVPYKKFGYFYEKNGTASKTFNVDSGVDDISGFNMLNSYDYQDNLSFWNTKACNMINGTDGMGFPPRTSKKPIYFFNDQLCRSLPLEYQKDVEQDGVPGWRFAPSETVFGNVSINPDNECFCIGGPPCAGTGLFNISTCQFDVPSYLSWPHFFQADPKYKDAVVGLKPNKSKHQFTFDVNPDTGTPMGANARMQINFEITPVKEIKAVKNITNMIFPVLWFQDGVPELNQKNIDLLKMASVLPKVAKRSLLLGCFIIGGMMFVMALILVLSQQSQNKKKLAIAQRDIVGHANPIVSTHYPDK